MATRAKCAVRVLQVQPNGKLKYHMMAGFEVGEWGVCRSLVEPGRYAVYHRRTGFKAISLATEADCERAARLFMRVGTLDRLELDPVTHFPSGEEEKRKRMFAVSILIREGRWADAESCAGRPPVSFLFE